MILTFMVHSIAVASITTLETELAAGGLEGIPENIKKTPTATPSGQNPVRGRQVTPNSLGSLKLGQL